MSTPEGCLLWGGGSAPRGPGLRGVPGGDFPLDGHCCAAGTHPTGMHSCLLVNTETEQKYLTCCIFMFRFVSSLTALDSRCCTRYLDDSVLPAPIFSRNDATLWLLLTEKSPVGTFSDTVDMWRHL